MREIKFRGKRIDNGEWVYGFYAYKAESNKHYILVETSGEHCPSYFTEYEVDPATVGQYTKVKEQTPEHKEGREIYEGDVVRCYGGERCQGYWQFDKVFTIHDITNPFSMMDLTEIEYCEILGNIYENPKLLEASK